jgi:hypothetical protein
MIPHPPKETDSLTVPTVTTTEKRGREASYSIFETWLAQQLDVFPEILDVRVRIAV